MLERVLIGWDIGGAHVKACRMERGEVDGRSALVRVAGREVDVRRRVEAPAVRARGRDCDHLG